MPNIRKVVAAAALSGAAWAGMTAGVVSAGAECVPEEIDIGDFTSDGTHEPAIKQQHQFRDML